MQKNKLELVSLKYLAIILFLLLVIAGGIVFAILKLQNSSQGQAENVDLVVNQAARLKTGGTTTCARLPEFINRTGLQQPVAIDAKQSAYPGVVLRELEYYQRKFQHPSWKVTGHVATTVRDAKGNIYVIPVPSIGLDTNPLEKRNTVYKIDSVTAEMEVLIELPASEGSLQNPFGTVGITIDCDTNSLYVSSVAGSTPTEENGRVYQIDLDAKQIVSQWQGGIDVIGLAVFNFNNQKRLYIGAARSSSALSIPLGVSGGFLKTETEPRYELSLLAIKNGNSAQVGRIGFAEDDSGKDVLIVVETEFAYRMNAETGRQYKRFIFDLDEANERWEFRESN